MNETYHFYRCIDSSKLPQYAFVDFSNGLVGYPNKLAEEVARYGNAYYLGHMTEKEVIDRPKFGRKPRTKTALY